MTYVSMDRIVDSAVSNDVARAVSAAIGAGWDVKKFVAEAQECWREELQQKLRWDMQSFNKAQA